MATKPGILTELKAMPRSKAAKVPKELILNLLSKADDTEDDTDEGNDSAPTMIDINRTLLKISSDVKAIRNTQHAIQDDIRGLKDDFNTLSIAQEEIKTEFNDLKASNTGIKQDICITNLVVLRESLDLIRFVASCLAYRGELR